MGKADQNHELYVKRKDSGVCIRCGKPTDGEHSRCKDCRDYASNYQRKTREWCRENHLCVICRKEHVYGNDKTCPECRAKDSNRVYKRILTTEQRNALNENAKARYAKNKDSGICVTCGKRKAATGRVRCPICLELHRNYKKNEVFSDVRV